MAPPSLQCWHTSIPALGSVMHCHQHLGMQERHRDVVTWSPHCMQVTQAVFAHRVSTELCTVTTLPEVTHADGCELSFFFSKRKAGP